MVSTGAALHYKDPVILTSKDPVKEAKTKNWQERGVHARRSAVIASIALNKEKNIYVYHIQTGFRIWYALNRIQPPRTNWIRIPDPDPSVMKAMDLFMYFMTVFNKKSLPFSFLTVLSHNLKFLLKNSF